MSQHYLLDTNICIYLINQRPESVLRRFSTLKPSQVSLSMVTWGELYYGAYKSEKLQHNLRNLQQLSGLLEVLPLPVAAAEHYGRLRADLQRVGRPIGGNDLWIAAHALAERYVLVTHNTKEFERVEGLSVENWVEN
ncbi:MAG: type II toxin-antitoxin system VapC family toxin [Moraxellaceae bacterium]